MNGWLPLTWSDLAAWAKSSGAIVLPAEWSVLRQMEQAFLSVSRTREAGKPTGFEQEITPDAFDAVFG